MDGTYLYLCVHINKLRLKIFCELQNINKLSLLILKIFLTSLLESKNLHKLRGGVKKGLFTPAPLDIKIPISMQLSQHVAKSIQMFFLFKQNLKNHIKRTLPTSAWQRLRIVLFSKKHIFFPKNWNDQKYILPTCLFVLGHTNHLGWGQYGVGYRPDG